MLKRSDELEPFFRHKIPLIELHGIVETGVDHYVCTCGDPECKNQGKHPTTLGGVHTARLFTKDTIPPKYNVGVACGDEVVVLDIDVRNQGHVALADLEKQYGPLPKTWVAFSGGGGNHYYFKGGKYKKFKIADGIDFQTAGFYVVAPGCLHKSGRYYEWESYGHPDDVPLAELPQWIAALAESHATTEVTTREGSIDVSEIDWKVTLARLNEISPDCSYTQWIEIGMALEAIKTIGGKRFNTYAIWDHWSSKAVKYRGESDTRYHWNSFRSESRIKKGKTIITPRTIHQIADDYILKKDMQISIPDLSIHQVKIDDHPLAQARGLVKDISLHLLAHARCPYHDLALASALSLVSICAQGTYKISGNPLSLYVIVLAPAATGKDDYFSFCQETLMRIEPDLLMAVPNSNFGQKNELFVRNSRGLFIDEIQDKLKAWSNPKAPSSQAEILSDWKKAFNGGSLQSSATKSGLDRAVTDPRLSIFGVGTPDAYADLLESKVIEGGLLSRFTLFTIAKPVPAKFRNPKVPMISDYLLSKLKSLHYAGINKCYTESDYKEAKNIYLSSALVPAKVPPFKAFYNGNVNIPFSPEAEEALLEYHEKKDAYFLSNCREDDAASQRRCFQAAEKFAVFNAIGAEASVVGIADVQFGIALAEHTLKAQLGAMGNYAGATPIGKGLSEIMTKYGSSGPLTIQTIRQRIRKHSLSVIKDILREGWDRSWLHVTRPATGDVVLPDKWHYLDEVHFHG